MNDTRDQMGGFKALDVYSLLDICIHIPMKFTVHLEILQSFYSENIQYLQLKVRDFAIFLCISRNYCQCSDTQLSQIF